MAAVDGQGTAADYPLFAGQNRVESGRERRRPLLADFVAAGDMPDAHVRMAHRQCAGGGPLKPAEHFGLPEH